MLIRKAYKFRLKPSGLQAELMTQFAGQARFLWNKALALNLERLQQKQKILYYPELNFWTTLWKKSDEYAFLRQCPAHVLQQKLRDLDRAFKDAFDKKQPNKRLPRFKKKGLGDSFRFPAPEQVRLAHRHITFPKLGKMRFFNSRAVEGKIRNYTISRRGAHWYVSIQVECLVDTNLHAHKNKQAIGLDMGIKHFVTTSDGEQIAPINSFRQLSEKLARSQRKASKKQKFSSNWKKAMQRVAKVHQRIADQRRDFQHKLSTELCKNHTLIIVEALKIKNMSRSASGTREEPVWINLYRDKTPIKNAIVEISDSLHLIPSNLNNSRLDVELTQSASNLRDLIKDIISPIRSNYDLIIIDCPPAINKINTAVTCASDLVLVPLNPDPYAMDGLDFTLSELTRIKKEFKLSFDYRVLWNKYDARERLGAVYMHELIKREDMVNKILPVVCRVDASMKNAIFDSKSVFELPKKAPIREDIDQFAKEILGINSWKEKKSNPRD